MLRKYGRKKSTITVLTIDNFVYDLHQGMTYDIFSMVRLIRAAKRVGTPHSLFLMPAI